MTHGSLFSGIGGFDLAAQWMGWENKFHCEWNEFGQKILNYYWPEAECFGDITKTDFKKYNGTIDIISGGFPCQPYSVAGKRKGKEDNRHLWPEMLRAIREIQPTWIVGENVYGIVNWDNGVVFHEVQSEMESEGYKVLPIILPACGLGADHRRRRTWFLAYSERNSNTAKQREEGQKEGLQGKRWSAGQSRKSGRTDSPFSTYDWSQRNERFQYQEIPKLNGIQRSEDGGILADFTNRPYLSTPALCRSYDGISIELDSFTISKWANESVKAYGNAIVPQIAFQIFKTIQQYENQL